jgi:hypothetical protein
MSQPTNDVENGYLNRVVVDTCLRKFYLYSDIGETKEVECESTQQFIDVLEVVRALVPEDCVVYAEPLTKSST